MTRAGLFRYVRWHALPSFEARGWLAIADLGEHHGRWSVLCWHCDCGEVKP